MINDLHYYSFKIFPRFWLVKSTRIIHHNQLLFAKFRNSFVILNRWRRKCSLLKIIEPSSEKTWGSGCVIFGEQKDKELMFSFKSWKISWIKNKAITEFGFRRIWRILKISDGVITLLDLQNSSYPTQPHSIIANYYMALSHIGWKLPNSRIWLAEMEIDRSPDRHLDK